MEKVQDHLSKIPNMLVDIINKQKYVQECEDYFTKAEKEIKHFKKHGTFKISLDNEATTKPSLRGSQRRGVLNENGQENVPIVKLERISEISSNDTVPDQGNRDSLKENVKIEMSDMPPPQLPVKKNRQVKKDMSVGSVRSTRSKASKKKDTSIDSNPNRDSDVVLQKQALETITLTDSEGENSEQTTRVTRTKGRKKDKNSNEENAKRSRSSSSDVEKRGRSTRTTRKTKRQKSDELSVKEASVYEDAEWNLPNAKKSASPETSATRQTRATRQTSATRESSATRETSATRQNVAASKQKLDETYVTNKKDAEHNADITQTIQKDVTEKIAMPNETVVISTPKVVKNKVTPINVRDIMTDDEDDNITITLPQKVTKVVKNGAKAIFSPFEGSPVKKRVEAFEKLGAETTSEIPIRVIKTRNRIFNNEREDGKTPVTPSYQSSKSITPQMANRYLTAISGSAPRTTKTNFINESFISSKSASALKASQQEFRDRENRRREKEAEAVRKRDALIQAQIEEKKKKRLEKQNKAQQMREALEKNKLKILEETEKTKEEKRKQVLAEKQEKIRRQQEETERRRLEVLKKAMEEKRKEEERRKVAEEEQEKLKQLELKKAAEQERAKAQKKKGKQLPIYLRVRPPLLPTEDCYDSDDGASHSQIRKPAWSSRDKRERQLRGMKYVNKDVITNFFGLVCHTPDLQAIFESIDPRKLKRTSSAVWKVAPRFTFMPESIAEAGEEE